VPIRRVPLSTRVFENFRFYDRLRKGGGVGVSAYREVESGDWAGMTGNGHGCNCTLSVWHARSTIAVERGRRVRDAEKRGRRSSLRILLHFIDGGGLEEGGTCESSPAVFEDFIAIRRWRRSGRRGGRCRGRCNCTLSGVACAVNDCRRPRASRARCRETWSPVVFEDFIIFRRWCRSGGGKDTRPVSGT